MANGFALSSYHLTGNDKVGTLTDFYTQKTRSQHTLEPTALLTWQLGYGRYRLLW